MSICNHLVLETIEINKDLILLVCVFCGKKIGAWQTMLVPKSAKIIEFRKKFFYYDNNKNNKNSKWYPTPRDWSVMECEEMK